MSLAVGENEPPIPAREGNDVVREEQRQPEEGAQVHQEEMPVQRRAQNRRVVNRETNGRYRVDAPFLWRNHNGVERYRIRRAQREDHREEQRGQQQRRSTERVPTPPPTEHPVDPQPIVEHILCNNFEGLSGRTNDLPPHRIIRPIPLRACPMRYHDEMPPPPTWLIDFPPLLMNPQLMFQSLEMEVPAVLDMIQQNGILHPVNQLNPPPAYSPPALVDHTPTWGHNLIEPIVGNLGLFGVPPQDPHP